MSHNNLLTLAALASFLAPAVVGALTSSGPALVLAGVTEGAVLGAAQCLVLRRIIPRLNARDWIVVTALAAGFAWAVALLAVHYGEPLGTLPLAVLAASTAAITGAAHAWILRRP